MSDSTASFRQRDIVSYKYNGLQGEVTAVEDNGYLEVTFPSQNRLGGTIVVTLAQSEVELISGAKKLLSA
jgi:hypothetical protein